MRTRDEILADPPDEDDHDRDEDMFQRLAEVGVQYDSRRTGSARSLRMAYRDGGWEISWRNGPFDGHGIDARASTAMGALVGLIIRIEAQNLTDEIDAAE